MQKKHLQNFGKSCVDNMVYGAILAGGIGKRMGNEYPKQFLEINEKPIIVYSIEKFHNIKEFNKIIVSSPKNFLDKTAKLVSEFFPHDDRIVVIEGGKERKDTINNSIVFAIEDGANKDSVMITHDAARIFVTSDLIKKSIGFAQKYGAASPVIPATDVIFESKQQNKLDNIPLRKNLYHSQTPQSFNIFKYLEIYNDLSDEEIKKLDEAMILFNLRNEDVYLFEGEDFNFKITTPFDIKIAKSMLE